MSSNYLSRRKFVASTSTIGVASLAGCLGGGDDGDFPSSALTITVPYDSGTNTDADARALAPEVESELDVSVAVENIEGAGGLRGLGELYSADDGHDVGFGYVPSNQISALTNPPGWEFEDMVGVGRYSNYAVGIIANPEYDIEDVDDLFDRFADGELEQVSGMDLGHTWHVIAVLLQENHGFEWDSWINYGGAGEVIQSVTSDETPVGITSEDNIVPATESGDVDYICCLGSSGTTLTPDDVPTWVDDLGNDDIDYMSMVTSDIYAPPQTSDEQQEILESAFEAAADSSAFEEYSEDRDQILEWGGGQAVEDDIEQVMTELPEQIDLEDIS
jgi:tripartite-type tricarboxylate transporter receptor subunit TctC